jgi:hypothetical protein
MHKSLVRPVKMVGAAALFLVLLMLLQQLLMPKYMSGVYEGRLIGEYYPEVKSHDVIFIGDCEVYENISPITLWEEYGISSFIRGSPQQLVWQSYHLLEETLRYETPKVVVFSVLSMMYNVPQSEAYNRLTLDGMRLSASKIGSIRASMTEDEQWSTYLLPILRYHDRWRELSGEDFRYIFGGGKVSHNGFMMRCDVRPAGFIPEGLKLPDYRFGSNSYDYLDRITALCKENCIELILLKAPSLYPYWYPQWDEQMSQYAYNNGLVYINTLDVIDEIGLDWDTDTYDAGLHLNLFGAEKLSGYLGGMLSERFMLQDHRTDLRFAPIWAGKVEAYYSMKQTQLRELEAFGEIRTLTY